MSIEDQYAAGSPLSVGLLTTFLNEAPIGTFKIDVLRRDRLHEPLVVDRVDFAALVDGDHRAVDDLLERRILAPQHDAVGFDRKRVRRDLIGARRFRGSHHAVEKDVVHHEGRRPIGFDHQEGLGMILGVEDIHPEILLRVDLGDLLDVGRARGRHDGLALEVIDRLEADGFLRHEPVGGDEMRDRERHLLLPLEIVRGRAAFQIDRSVGDQRNAHRRCHRVEVHLELVQPQLLLHGVDDPVAEVHGVADGLLLVVVIGKRNREFAVGERDRAGLLDFLQRSFQRRRGWIRLCRDRRRNGGAERDEGRCRP